MNRLLRAFSLLTALGLFAVVGAASCNKLPLLAPTGTVINLTVASDTAALNSTVDVIAVLIENGVQSSVGTGTSTSTTSSTAGAGTPVQNGTVVSFTTSIGTIEPAEAKTENGKVAVKLTTNGASGTATITAYWGGAKSTAQIKIGGANAKTITVTASPQNLPATGGTSTISARVDDANGNGIAGIPVLFSTTKGTLAATSAITASGGTATTTLTTTSAADVTASAASLTGVKVSIGVSTATPLTLTLPSTATAISTPVPFTISTGASGSLNNVSISYGDGSTKTIGALSGSQSVSHFYSAPGIYDIKVSGQDADGVTASQFGQVAIVGLNVGLTSSAPTVARGTSISFTATVTPSTASIARYDWDFNDGTTASSSSNTQNHVYDSTTATARTYVVTVTVVPTYGSSYTVTIQIPVT